MKGSFILVLFSLFFVLATSLRSRPLLNDNSPIKENGANYETLSQVHPADSQCMNNYLPNLMLGHGYNIISADPLTADRRDPGVTNSPVFVNDYITKNGAICEGGFRFPLKTTGTISKICTIQSQVTSVQSSSDFKNAVSARFEGHAALYGVEFSASAGFKYASHNTDENDRIVFYSAAECEVYNVGYQNVFFDPPQLDKSFIQAIKSLDSNSSASLDQLKEILSSPDSKQVFHKLYKVYGTHVVTQISSGARYIYRMSMDRNNYYTMKRSGFDVGVRLNVDVAAIKAGLKVESMVNDANKQTLKDSNVEETTYAYGASPPASNTQESRIEWATQIFSNPLPLRYIIEPLTNLLTPTFFDKYNAKRLVMIREAMLKFQEEDLCKLVPYCTRVVKQSRPEPEPPKPQTQAPKPPTSAPIPINYPIYRSTSIFGGGGGGAPQVTAHKKIAEISCRAGQYVDSFSIRYTDGSVQTVGGGGGGQSGSLILEPGDYIKSVRGYVGYFVDKLSFMTQKGRFLDCATDHTRENLKELFNPGQQNKIVGLVVKSGVYMDSIQFQYTDINNQNV